MPSNPCSRSESASIDVLSQELPQNHDARPQKCRPRRGTAPSSTPASAAGPRRRRPTDRSGSTPHHQAQYHTTRYQVIDRSRAGPGGGGGGAMATPAMERTYRSPAYRLPAYCTEAQPRLHEARHGGVRRALPRRGIRVRQSSRRQSHRARDRQLGLVPPAAPPFSVEQSPGASAPAAVTSAHVHQQSAPRGDGLVLSSRPFPLQHQNRG